MLPRFTEPIVEAVGFTAQAPVGDSFYNLSDLVIFNSTVSNIGGYYKTSSSQFLCPADGMYAFSFSIRSATGHQFYGAIMKESAELDGVFCDNLEGFSSGASNLAITICNKGERVWIRCLTDEDAVHNNSYGYTTFSGFLLNRL